MPLDYVWSRSIRELYVGGYSTTKYNQIMGIKEDLGSEVEYDGVGGPLNQVTAATEITSEYSNFLIYEKLPVTNRPKLIAKLFDT